MGVLTDDITRLVGEITAGRHSRAEFIKGLRRGVKDLGEEALSMRSRFQRDHHNMAVEARAERMNFVSGLNKTVISLLRSFTSDLSGAHRAWVGLSPIKRKPLEVEEKKRLEAKRRAKEEKVEAEKKPIKKSDHQWLGEEEKMVLETVSKSFKSSKQEKTRNKDKFKGKAQ